MGEGVQRAGFVKAVGLGEGERTLSLGEVERVVDVSLGVSAHE